MGSTGIIFNGKHSYRDFKLTIEKKEIGYPAKSKITETIPFMNGKYDFSTALSNGEDIFLERIISITFNIITDKYKTKSIIDRRKILYDKGNTILAWLFDTNGQKPLVLDENAGYYYDAEVINGPSLEDIVGNGKLKVNFVCYPFKKAMDLTAYSCSNTGTQNYTITNNGRQVTPIIKCTIPGIQVELGNKIYTLPEGKYPVWTARLISGDNTIKITGTDTVEISFREETL